MPTDMDWELLIFGDGDDRALIEKQIADSGIGKNIKLMGNRPLDQIAEAYQQADVFVLPSLRETSGNVLLEAMAYAVPIVAFDLELIKDEITFGMNSITRIFDKTDWRPTYYGIQDRQVYEKMEDSILDYYRMSDNVFVADQLGRYFQLPANFIQFPYNGNYHIYRGAYEDYSVDFSPNAYEVVYDGYSITYSLIEIAIYMGFKEIYLLGADCNYPKGEKNHFVESGFVDKNAASNPIRMRVGYQAAKEYADAHGIKIVNCTRGGMLETFKRMNLEDVNEIKENS